MQAQNMKPEGAKRLRMRMQSTKPVGTNQVTENASAKTEGRLCGGLLLAVHNNQQCGTLTT